MLVRPLGPPDLDEIAELVAREHREAHDRQPLLPRSFGDPEQCRGVLVELLASGFSGVVAVHDGHRIGVMCGKTADGVGFVPAHGLAVDPGHTDPTAVLGPLFAELAPRLLDTGAARFTVDHLDRDPLGVALSNLGFGRAAVFATQPPRPMAPATAPPVDVRVATPADLDAVAALSQVELTHRSTPPIYAPGAPRSLAATRAVHARLFDDDAVHFLARRGSHDVGLLTVERVSPAPRLCPDEQPYIGATATDPGTRGQGIGTALVLAALDWAAAAGHETLSVDFDAANPLSRPFWLGRGFQPTGYRLRRSIDVRYHRDPRRAGRGG